VWLRTQARQSELGFPYALAREGAEGFTKKEIGSANAKSASTLTITLV
jgi:hypothetical protein